MGNTMKVRLKEGKMALELPETLVQEFQSHINVVDRSTEGLAKSVDSMRAASEQLLKHLDKEIQSKESNIGTDSDTVENTRLVRHLIETIDSSVSDHKFVMMESLSKFFHFVVDTGMSHTTYEVESCPVFLVDEYKNNNTSFEVEDGMLYYDARIQSLQRKVEYLQKVYSLARSESDNLNTREETYRQEIKSLKTENESWKKGENEIERKTKRYQVQGDIYADEEEDSLKFVHIDETNKGRDEAHQKYLKIKTDTLKEEMQTLRNDMVLAKKVTEDTLKQKDEKISQLLQEIDIIKNDRVKVYDDKKTSTEDLIEITQTTPGTSSIEYELREKITSLENELQRKSRKVLHVYTKEEVQTIGFLYELTSFSYEFRANSIRRDIYQTLQREMETCNTQLKITTWTPSKMIGDPSNKIIIVDMIIKYIGELEQKLMKLSIELKAPPNIVILVFYDASKSLLCEEMETSTYDGFKQQYRTFKFGYSCYYVLESVKEKDSENLKALINFFQAEVKEDRYLSR